jgi:acyl dehydratase
VTREELEALVGTSFPGGTFEVSEEKNDAFVRAVHADAEAQGLSGGFAHPMFGHMAAHAGKGVDVGQFFEMCGASLEDGVVFGEGGLDFHAPLRAGVTYSVTGEIVAVARKTGARTGTFDAVTTRLEMRDPDGGLVVVSTETTIFPRREVAP